MRRTSPALATLPALGAWLLLAAATRPQAAGLPVAGQAEAPVEIARSAQGNALARAVREPRRTSGWELQVLSSGPRGERELWSAPWTPREQDFVAFLNESGSALALVQPRYAREGELVELWSRGRRSAALDADALGLPTRRDGLVLDEQGRWIAPAWDTARLRSLSIGHGATEVLDLLTVGGELVTIDLSNGWVERSSDAGGPTLASIEPALPAEVAERALEPFVDSLSAPARAIAGRPLEIELAGSFPTPGYAIVGYTLDTQRIEGGGLQIRLHAWASSLGGGPTAQVITSFRTKARLSIAEPGRHRLVVLAREGAEEPTREIEVVSARLALALEISGGITGRSERYELLSDGRWRHDGRTRLASPAALLRVSSALAALPSESVSARSPFGADLRSFRLSWVRGNAPLVAELDERTLDGPFQHVVEALEALEQDRPPGPPRWTIAPDQGRLVVKTRSAGLLKGLGHDHEIAAPGRSGELRFDPERPSEASLELVVDAASLVPLGEKDREEIRANMRTKVLEVTRFPRLVYRARRIDAKEIGEGRYEAVLHGELELHGVTKPLVVGARVAVTGDELVASGKLTLRLRDFGIDPPIAGLGTVKVADEVAIEFDLVARREG